MRIMVNKKTFEKILSGKTNKHKDKAVKIRLTEYRDSHDAETLMRTVRKSEPGSSIAFESGSQSKVLDVSSRV